MGIKHTAGFILHHGQMGTVCTHTRHRCGVCRYGCGLGISDPWVTHDEPYSWATLHHYLTFVIKLMLKPDFQQELDISMFI